MHKYINAPQEEQDGIVRHAPDPKVHPKVRKAMRPAKDRFTAALDAAARDRVPVDAAEARRVRNRRRRGKPANAK